MGYPMVGRPLLFGIKVIAYESSSFGEMPYFSLNYYFPSLIVIWLYLCYQIFSGIFEGYIKYCMGKYGTYA